jgi:radical SAM/Cys-rich protein
LNTFQKILSDHGLCLTRGKTTTLQVNIGRICNLACKHCHVEAGPGRSEIMSRRTMDHVIEFARRNSFPVIDITGGAPELVPGIAYLLENLAPLAPRIMLRSNLVILLDQEDGKLLELCRQLKVALVASFPSTNRSQTDAQRGEGTWKKSIHMLQRLNEIGYGKPDTGLDLYLVSNPAGAFLPANQCTAEKKFKADMARKWGLEFTSLFTFANVPLGRYRKWLVASDNYEAYMEKLLSSFNPATVADLMCRNLINISWDGFLYDCDFNMAAGLPYSGTPVHVSEVGKLEQGTPIMADDYCFSCTAGTGFT